MEYREQGREWQEIRLGSEGTRLHKALKAAVSILDLILSGA